MIKVLYILGRGRGGSTVLANVLGEAEGFFAAGEIRYLWDPVLTNDSPCGCGRSISRCEVWSQVLAQLGDVDRERAVDLQREVVRESRLFRLLRGSRPWPELDEFAALTARLYSAIASVTGARVIVDSSKRPAYGAFLMRVADLDPHYVHLVRDPRASAHSWKTRRYASARQGEVKRRNAVDSTLRWDVLNLSSEALLRRAGRGRGLRLRYEDFVASPRSSVDAIGELLSERDMTAHFVDETTVELGANHTIAGNPSRYRTGRLELRDPAEWRIDQRGRDRVVATLVALPLLWRYRYPVRARRPDPSTPPRT